jgi:hypothetical protein
MKIKPGEETFNQKKAASFVCAEYPKAPPISQMEIAIHIRKKSRLVSDLAFKKRI